MGQRVDVPEMTILEHFRNLVIGLLVSAQTPFVVGVFSCTRKTQKAKRLQSSKVTFYLECLHGIPGKPKRCHLTKVT